MAPQKERMPAPKSRGPMSGDDGRVERVHEPRRVPSNDDNLSIRSMDSSRDEMFSSRSFDRPKPACTPPHRLEGVKEGMRSEPATQIRQKDGLNGYATVINTPSGDDEVLHPNDDWLKQFAVVVQKRRRASAPGGSEIEMVRVRSPLLKAILSEHLAAYPDYSNAKSLFTMDIRAPFAPLLHSWDAIVRLMEEHPDSETRAHLKVLHDALVETLEKPLKKFEECRSTGRITYNSMWTIFKPGQLIYRKDVADEELIVKVVSANYGFDGDNAECFMIDGEYVCWDGNRFGLAAARYDLYDLGKVMNITELKAMPLDMHPDREAIKARVLKRGQKYAKFTRTELKAYTGPEGEANYSVVKQTDNPLQVLDRIIINPVGVGCTTIVQNLDPLLKVNPFDKPLREPLSESNASNPGGLRRQRERSCVTDLRKAREEWEKTKHIGVPFGRNYTLTEEQMLIAMAHVAVFDMTRKTWGWVGIGEVGDVPWNEDAYDDLVFPEDEKDLLLSIAKSHTDPPGNFESILEKKGKGTVICLNGPSGVGKTLAVEAIAEKLHMPLYSINIAEIIRDLESFENNLCNAFERCKKWNAIMLVTNVDFLLEKNLEAISRHDSIAIIVHHLSTHHGLVFFTSEKLSAIDPLLQSRFDLTIQVPALNAVSRRKVWENAITQALPLRQRHFTSEHLDQLSEKELSGREIKSVIKIAQMAAKGKDEGLKMVHLEKVLAVKERSKPKIEE